MLDYFRRQREEEARRNFEKGFSAGTAFGAILGGLIGGLAGVLTAPDSGKNTRRKIQENANEVKISLENELIEMKDKVTDEVTQSMKWLKKEIDDAKELFKREKNEFEKEVIDSVEYEIRNNSEE